ncbi:hypothetical protein GCM10007103_26990 [Salinimicrobium marinum]|uniref:DUF2116 family Zn-ribbon domain-containing protein n=1 Tax=Salinimicrobium marinum TaxID=680283 RepID=A0A918SIP3_9FLAO|nr:hypothetical protein [Salinimicrobium marinum]GHA44350.1 hypothetical protein GCM10007103_26990 [Salinimicrobium marinum]
MTNPKQCLACNSDLQGRPDKKFCDPYCKSAWHYSKNRDEDAGFYHKVDRQLKTNRKILKSFNKAGKATVQSEVLLGHGFDPKFFTHYWKNNKGDVYLFVYEFGFLTRKENGKKKYILVTWQQYMEK